MKVSESQLANLKLIYESEQESIHLYDFIDDNGKWHPNPKAIVAQLLELNLIETEHDENRFFLTPEGYDIVEKTEALNFGATKHNRIDSVSKTIHKIGAKKVKTYIWVWLFAFGLFVTFYLYLYPNALDSDANTIDIKLSDETIEALKEQSKSVEDSLKALKTDSSTFSISE